MDNNFGSTDEAMPKKAVRELHALRRANLRRISKTIKAVKMAEELNVTTGYISQLIGKSPSRNIGEALARRIESALKLPPGALDREPGEPMEGGLDGDLLRAAVEAVNHVLSESGTELSDNAYAEVLRSVYEDHANSEPTTYNVLLKYVRLAESK